MTWYALRPEAVLKKHIRLACQRCRLVTDHVRRLCNTNRGTSPSLLTMPS